ncbi:MAG: class I SAM-dependent methyltransferase [Oxalobacter sp.]|nr:MAG: class I SAM-dependent methyltransferase [Oxalobacter sp.]
MGKPPDKDSIIALGEWFATPAGSYVRDWEQARLDVLTADIFGYKAVQIGMPQIDALRANRMQHRWMSDMRLPDEACDDFAKSLTLVHDYCDLPFATQSMDLVVLPHVLEFAAEPHQILREVNRVLIPEGQVIICGFNPASLWGMRQMLGRVTGAHFMPVNGEFIGLHRMKDWLKLLGMETNRGHFGCYLPPCTSKNTFSRYAFLEKMGDRWWPFLGGAYIVQAIKRVRGMTLIGPIRARSKPHAINIPVAGKNIHHKNGQS